jgi:hypothetical protein
VLSNGLLVALLLVIILIATSFGAIIYLSAGRGPVPRFVTLTGRVLAGAYGLVPVALAVVHITPVSGGGSTSDVTADGAGYYEYTALAGTTYTVWATLGTHWGTATGPSVTESMPGAPSTVVLNLTIPASDVTGGVRDGNTTSPIVGASMSIADPGGSWWCCQLTDANGRYILWTIAPGTYTLTAAASGYNATTLTVYVGSMAATAALDFSLAPAP